MTGGIDRSRLDALLRAALEAAVARIEKDGAFYPLVFELRHSAAIHHVAVLDSGAIDGQQSVIDRLTDLLRQRAAEGTISAAAIASHRPGEQAIEIQLRAADHASDRIVPYAVSRSGWLRRTRKLALGPAASRAADNRIF